MSVLSLVLLGLLACGYVGNVSIVSISKLQNAPALPYLPLTSIGAGNGRFRFINLHLHMAPTVPAASSTIPKPGIQTFTRFRPFRWPGLRECLWEFDWRHLSYVDGTSQFIVACPIWCLALPLLVAPTLWWRRRQRRPQPAGFSVLTATGDAERPDSSHRS